MRPKSMHFKLPGGSEVRLRAPSEHPPELQRVIAKDRRWFQRHPRRRHRLRFTTPAELDDAVRRGLPLIGPETVAVVTFVKSYGTAGQERITVGALEMTRHPNTFGENECQWLMENAIANMR